MTEEPTSVLVSAGVRLVTERKNGGIKSGPKIWKMTPEPFVPPAAQVP